MLFLPEHDLVRGLTKLEKLHKASQNASIALQLCAHVIRIIAFALHKL